MNKEEAIIEFIKGLRIAFSNAAAYDKEHPYFKKIVENFKQKLHILFNYLSAVKVGVSPDSLFVDGKYWGKTMLYIELASMLHLRKIRSIQFNEGVSTEELINLLNLIAKPAKEILKSGGLKDVLKQQSHPHIIIEVLDYSQFLQEKGEEAEDLWKYLFQQAVNKKDIYQINEFADNFESIIGKFKLKDLIEDEELRKNICNFLQYLKEKQYNKFNNCAKGLLKFILSYKDSLEERQLSNIKAFFQGLNSDNFAQALLEEIVEKVKFDRSNLKLFMQIVNSDEHKNIATLFGKKIEESEAAKNDPRIKKDLKELFSTTEQTHIPAVYLKALDSFIKGSVSEGTVIFDKKLERNNYYYALLNLFIEYNEGENADFIFKCLVEEYDRIVVEKNTEHLKNLLVALDEKRKRYPDIAQDLEKLEKKILEFSEALAFAQEKITDLEYFIERINTSVLGFDYYVSKIFNQGNVSTLIFKLLLKLFPDKLSLIYEKLRERHTDIDFMVGVVDSLEKIDTSSSSEMLKRIFGFSNNLIKIEVIRAMRSSFKRDNEFLFSVLDKGDTFLKREALAVLKNDENCKEKALKKLLNIRNLFAINNRRIMENISVVEALKLKDAEKYLVSLSRRPFFWNRKLREKAKEVLKNWHAG